MTKYFKVKDGKLDLWRSWCSLLSTTLKEQAIATLREENCLMERMVLLDSGLILAEGEYSGEKKPADMTVPLNVVHRELFLECLDPAESDGTTTGIVLYELHG